MPNTKRRQRRAPKDGAKERPSPASQVVIDALKDTTESVQNPDQSLQRLDRARRAVIKQRQKPPAR